MSETLKQDVGKRYSKHTGTRNTRIYSIQNSMHTAMLKDVKESWANIENTELSIADHIICSS
jgi:hypothetical protein